MFPVLTTDSLLGTLGKGTLTDCISCVVEEERNGAYELTLEYPQSGVHAGDIALNMLIEAKPNFTDDPQPFRIYSITKSISGTIEVHAQHISYDLGGVIVAPVKLTGATCQQAGEHLVYGTGFSFSTDKAVSNDFIINEPSSARSWLAGKSGSLLDVYGSGEFYYDGMDVKLLGQRGTNREVEIRYGKNLSELTSESTCENMYSGVVAYYVAEDGTVTSGTEVSTGLSGITRVLALDRSDAYDTPPTTADLTTDATNYIANHNLTTPKTNITLDFVQASKLKDRVDLCDTVSIYYEAFGVSATAKCIRTKWDTLTERYTETEFGDPKNNITDTIIEVEKKAEEAVSETTMQHAINEATNQITGNNGGYVVLHDANSDGEPDEILIMDSPDISTAVDLWRWNNGGLGFSSTGYSGQYGIAITSTGEIVADFITAGTLNANVIKAGILQDAANKNSWNMTTGALTITNGSINITTTSETDDKLVLTYGNYQSTVRAGGFVFGYKNGAVYETRSTLSLDGASYYDFSGNLVARMGLNGPSISGTGSGLFDAYKENASYVVGFAAHGAGFGEDTTNGICTTYYTNNGFYTNLGDGNGFNQIIDLETYPQYGYTQFDLKNASAVWGAGISVTSTGGALSLGDGSGTTRISAVASSGTVDLRNSNSKTAASMGVYNDQHGYIYLYDGTSNTLRSWYDYTGLKFADSNGNQTCIYPPEGALGWIKWTSSNVFGASSFSLENCNGTIANVSVQLWVDSVNKVACIEGRIRINNFSRTGGGPGVTLNSSFGSRSDQPSWHGGVVCNQNGIIPSETVYLQLDYYGKLHIRTTESVVNFSGTAMTMIIPQTFFKY